MRALSAALAATAAIALGACQAEPHRRVPTSIQGMDPGRPDAPADAAPDPCVAACVRDGQARATSIEQIEAECRAACAADAGP